MQKFLPGGLAEVYKKHKKAIIGGGIFAGVVALLLLFVWFFITPYNHGVERQRQGTFYASENEVKYTAVRAKVLSVDGKRGQVRVEDGVRKDAVIDVRFWQIEPSVGDRVLVDVERGGTVSDAATNFWRIPGIVLLAILFVVLIVVVAGRQGVMSIVGLLVSVGVIAFGLIPAVLNGVSAFWASVASAFVIALVSVVVSHGWRWRTAVSLVSILLVLSLAVLLALLGGWMGHLTGIYDEVSAALAFTAETSIDMRGVLVGGIIIATLGVLDDIITAQTAAIDELHKAQPKLTFTQLFLHGRSIGREHVAALVNTLALAYIGVALPLVLSLVLNFDSTRSIWLLFNSEFIAQEVVRTLVSSMALVLAIPVSTAIAAWAILHKQQIFATLKMSNPNKTEG